MMGSAARALDRMAARLKSLCVRGVVELVDDDHPRPLLQMRTGAGSVVDLVELHQPYGLTAVVPKGAGGLLVARGANRTNSAAVAVDHRDHRPRLNVEGEVMVYDWNGQYVHFKADGTIAVLANAHVTVEAPTTTIKGDLVVEGSIQAAGDVTDQSAGTGLSMAAMRSAYNQHTHGTSPPPAPLMV